MKTVSVLILGLLAFNSCSKMGYVNTRIYQHPIIEMPDHIKRIGIVNRSIATDKKQVLNVIEGLLTGEGLMEDKQGSKACLKGAETQFNIDTFVKSIAYDTIAFSGTGTAIMQTPLTWEVIDKICTTQDIDALLVLESFDTDQDGSNTANAVNTAIGAALSGKLPSPSAFRPSQNSRVYLKMGWRLYDNKAKAILDQARLNDYFSVWDNSWGWGINDVAEFAKRDAIKSAAFIGGRAYVTRLFPSWVWVRRDYFRRTGFDLKMADRMVRVNDFAGARKIWVGLTAHPKRKIAGRACFNMALSEEITGNLEAAIEWAQKSYSMYNVREARSYATFLTNRLQIRANYEEKKDD